MLGQSLKAQSLVLLSIFVIGGLASPLVHWAAHGMDSQPEPACEHESAVGLHYDEQSGQIEDYCLQCVRHQSMFAEQQRDNQLSVSSELIDPIPPEKPAHKDVAAQQARAPPARLV